MERLAQITEKTVIPISLVAVIMAAVFYVAGMQSKIEEMKELQNDYNFTLKHIDERLSRIEGKLGVNLGSENEYDDDGSPDEISSKSSRFISSAI